MKKFISTILASMLFISCLAVILPNNAIAESEINGDFMYENGEITEYVGNSGICEIPENTNADFLSGKKAKESKPIKKLIVNKGVTLPLLDFLTDLKEVEFKDGVTEIESHLLEGCKSLERVVLSSTVKEIGDRAFMNCENLKTIEWTDGLQSIGEYAFCGAKSLSGDLTIPDTVTIISKGAFQECGNLNKVHLPDNLNTADGCFGGTSIEKINIPDAMLDNPPRLYADEITFNSDMTVKIYNAISGSKWCINKYLKGKTDKTLGKYDGFAIVENTVLRYVGTDKTPTVPEGVKTIGDGAFLYCDIDTVSLPKSLETISDSAFRTSTLKNIVVPQNVKYIGDNAFENCPLLESVTVEGSPELGDTSFRITTVLTEDKLVFKNNSEKLMEKVLEAGTTEDYLPSFYELLNENRERVGFTAINVPAEVQNQPTTTPKTTVEPKETVKPTVTVKPTTKPSAFTDTENSEYSKEIAELTELGIISGFEDNTFRPKTNVTRAQAAKMFAVVKGFSDEPSDYAYISQKSDFSDLNMSHWAFKYVHYLTGEGSHIDDKGNDAANVHVIDGFEDGSFRPDENVTIIQLLKMAVACFGDYGYYEEADSSGGYPDGYVKTAAKYGFSNGIDMQDINAGATREQTAKIISNTINIPVKAALKCDLISDDHKIIQNTVVADFDGTNKHFPRLTFKDMLKTGDNSLKINIESSPLEGEEAFFAYGKIDSVSANEITISLSPKTLINTDGSIYDYDGNLVVGDNGFDLKADNDTYYYFKIKKQDNKWIVDNYAVR